MRSAGDELKVLAEQYPMLPGVGPLETFTDCSTVNGVTIRLAGLAARCREQCVTGAAASLTDSPLFRAYMELTERVSIVDATAQDQDGFALRDRAGRLSASLGREMVFPESADPSTWSWARSNGVAVGATWEDAARRARLELIERDVVLRSWYGELRPERVALAGTLVPPALAELYEFEAYTFDASHADAEVVAFLGSPREATAPTLIGFAGRADIDAAVQGAFSECLQQLGFLWGEALPTESPVPTATPDFHQDFFLFPAHSGRLQAWLRGEHARYRGVLDAQPSVEEPLYVDLTPRHLASRLCVAKAIPAGHVPLAFGPRHPLMRPDAPSGLWVHPIA